MSSTICSKRARVSFIVRCFGPGRIRRDERQVDLGLEQRGELHLGLLRRFLQPLQRHLIFRQLDARLALELGDDPIHHPLVDVVAAQVRIAIGGLHFHHAFAHFQDRDIERAAAEIVYGDGFVLLLVQAVSQRGGGRLVDDSHHFESRDLARILGRLALRIVEVGRNRNHGLRDFAAQISFGRFLQLAQDHRRNLGRRILLAADVDARVVRIAADHLVGHHLHFFGDFVIAPAHEALDRKNRVLGIGDGLALRDLPHQPLTTLGERHHGRCRAVTFLVGNYGRLSALHHRNHGVRGSQIDAYDLSHASEILLLLISTVSLLNFSALLSSLFAKLWSLAAQTQFNCLFPIPYGFYGTLDQDLGQRCMSIQRCGDTDFQIAVGLGKPRDDGR